MSGRSATPSGTSSRTPLGEPEIGLPARHLSDGQSGNVRTRICTDRFYFLFVLEMFPVM